MITNTPALSFDLGLDSLLLLVLAGYNRRGWVPHRPWPRWDYSSCGTTLIYGHYDPEWPSDSQGLSECSVSQPFLLANLNTPPMIQEDVVGWCTNWLWWLCIGEGFPYAETLLRLGRLSQFSAVLPCWNDAKLMEKGRKSDALLPVPHYGCYCFGKQVRDKKGREFQFGYNFLTFSIFSSAWFMLIQIWFAQM